MPQQKPRFSEPTRTYQWPKYLVGFLAIGVVSVALWARWAINKERSKRAAREQAASRAMAGTEGTGQLKGKVWIPGGTFIMGWSKGEPEESHEHEVRVNGFWLGKFEVTNAEFEAFTKATGYKTMAGRKPEDLESGLRTKLYPPGTPPEFLTPGSLVFTPSEGPVPLNRHHTWWRYQPGASWRHPEGPETNLEGRKNHPVVHVNWFDAQEYCAWRTKVTGVKHRLPTEAEWEFAARGGKAGQEFIWGNDFEPDGKPMANIWHGNFPYNNTKKDGHELAAPVGSYPPNDFGLHDMAGNVWEWCADWYRADYYKKSPKENPKGPSTSWDPGHPGMQVRSQRGGSFLCTDLYCGAFRPSRREQTEPHSGLSHTGFRVLAEGKPPRPKR